jgi:hypothetical protein
MPRVLRIKVEEGKSLEETTEWLALSASAVLDKLFPVQWDEGMRLMARRIDQMLAEHGKLLRPPTPSRRRSTQGMNRWL